MIRFDNLPPEVMQAMCTPMHQILPPAVYPSNPAFASGALFLGSLQAASDKDLLRENGITHLVQVLDVPWLSMTENDGFHCYRIDLLDQSTADLKPHLEAVCNHIDATLRSGHSILVHCQQGISRSAAVVIAYLIRNKGMSFDKAYSLLKRKRACIQPNVGFVRTLQEWEISLPRPPATRRFTS